ncbi:MAG TPA: site-specific integrase [Clostridiales bacterium]|nr:site-specific integrase [Clostridiales bacterium]
MRKASNGREYANKLSVFLNFLSGRNIEYDQASRNDVLAFIDALVYGLSKNDNVFNVKNASVTYNTLSLYITVITEFYKWLHQKVNGKCR